MIWSANMELQDDQDDKIRNHTQKGLWYLVICNASPYVLVKYGFNQQTWRYQKQNRDHEGVNIFDRHIVWIDFNDKNPGVANKPWMINNKHWEWCNLKHGDLTHWTNPNITRNGWYKLSKIGASWTWVFHIRCKKGNYGSCLPTNHPTGESASLKDTVYVTRFNKVNKVNMIQQFLLFFWMIEKGNWKQDNMVTWFLWHSVSDNLTQRFPAVFPETSGFNLFSRFGFHRLKNQLQTKFMTSLYELKSLGESPFFIQVTAMNKNHLWIWSIHLPSGYD